MSLCRVSPQLRKAELIHRSTWTSRLETNQQGGSAFYFVLTLFPWQQVCIYGLKVSLEFASFQTDRTSSNHVLLCATCRELPLLVHTRERLWLQGQQLPPHHPSVYVPRWRLHQPQRLRGQVYLRPQVRWWELCAEAHGSRWGVTLGCFFCWLVTWFLLLRRSCV